MRPKTTFETSKTKSSKARLFAEAAERAALVSSPVRIQILFLLAQTPGTVEALALALGESVANTSQHLRRLAHGGLVTVRKKGTQREYDLATPAVQRFVGNLYDLTSEVSRSARDLEEELVPAAVRSPLSLEEAAGLARAQKALLLDVRTAEEVALRPVGGALHVPVLAPDDFEMARRSIVESGAADPRRASPLPVFVFCRGRLCVTAARTAMYLRGEGFDAWCLREAAAAANGSDEEPS